MPLMDELCVQVKLWYRLRTRAIPERLRGVFTTRRYTNPRLPLPLPLSEKRCFQRTREHVQSSWETVGLRWCCCVIGWWRLTWQRVVWLNMTASSHRWRAFRLVTTRCCLTRRPPPLTPSPLTTSYVHCLLYVCATTCHNGDLGLTL